MISNLFTSSCKPPARPQCTDIYVCSHLEQDVMMDRDLVRLSEKHYNRKNHGLFDPNGAINTLVA